MYFSKVSVLELESVMLVDRFGRPLKNLRISVTARCNYRCIYCHNEGVDRAVRDFLEPRDLEAIARVAVGLGIDEFKLTGGEPLIRDDIVEIVAAIARARPRDLSMTTNGSRLDVLAHSLAEAGLMRINVSVPSLRRERYRYVTGMDMLERVVKGIRAAIDSGLTPLTINVVLLRGINEDELWNFVDFARRLEARLRIIELEPITMPQSIFEELYASVEPFEKELEERASHAYRRELHARPIYVVDGGVEVELVKWLGNPQFCAHCTRARLTPDAVLKPCILAREGIDLKPYLRPEPRETELRQAFLKLNSMRKPFISMQP